MDDRRARNHARDRRLVLAVLPSSESWQPAVTTEEILKVVRLPRRRVLTLLHELDVDGLAAEAGGRWRLHHKGPPSRGVVEIDYSVVPSWQRRGIAERAVRVALGDWV
jgi:RimJ/RimL family protein N-acetyltransferase